MGIQSEFNPDLALRNILEFVQGRRKREECVPKPLEAGVLYDFLKKGQRNYWLLGEVPLVETQGEGRLSRPLASVVIIEPRHVVENNEVWTRGKYKVIDVFDPNDPRAHFEGMQRVRYVGDTLERRVS